MPTGTAANSCCAPPDEPLPHRGAVVSDARFRIPDRRRFLGSLAALSSAAALPKMGRATTPIARAPSPRTVATTLRAASTKHRLVGTDWPPTEVWSYNATVPGPEIRARQGDRLSIAVANGLDQETTVHWHGIRLPNAMDGVPHLTQTPIAPRGGRFEYAFDLPDAGTFWYHPHARSSEQVDRGLAGVVIVDEREPIRVDRDVSWVLDDWRLDRDARIVDDFGSLRDATHDGRIGNAVTVNGAVTDDFAVRAGERLRLRLVNVANARVFALEFEGHSPTVIALDGHPVRPHSPPGGRVVLGPGMRADLVLDCGGDPGGRYRVIDRFSPRLTYRVVDLAYAGAPALRASPLDAPVALPANPLPEPDLAGAVRHRVELAGGMMGGVRGGPEAMRALLRKGLAWTMNDVAASNHAPDPLLVVERGRTVLLELVNATAWWHPIHLHGFAFRILNRNGKPESLRPWADTALLAPEERAEVAFVADNPGNWMLHCHVLEHQGAGMMAVVRVT